MTITIRPALRPAEIATICASADRASRALCLRELRFWRRYALPVDPVADAALAAYQGRAHAIAKVKHIRSLADHNRDCCRAWGVERQALLDARAEAAELGRLLRDLVEVVNATPDPAGKTTPW